MFGLCVVDEPEGGVRDRSGSTYQRSAQLDQLIADVAGEEDMDWLSMKNSFVFCVLQVFVIKWKKIKK